MILPDAELRGIKFVIPNLFRDLVWIPTKGDYSPPSPSQTWLRGNDRGLTPK